MRLGAAGGLSTLTSEHGKTIFTCRGWRWVGVAVAEAALSVLQEDMLTPSRQAIIAALGYYHLWI